VTGIGHHGHRGAGVAKDSLYDHEHRVEDYSDGKRGSEICGRVNVTRRSMCVPFVIMAALVVV
jgi:hypothetical protein